MLGLDDYGSGSDSDSSQKNSSKPKAAPSQLAKKATTKGQRPPKKITIALPTISAKDDDDDLEDDDIHRPAKKQKTGAGMSSLLSMLPTPSSRNPAPAPQRVLGGGSGPGLNFRTRPVTQDPVPEVSNQIVTLVNEDLSAADAAEPSPLFRPTSLAKGRKNISVEEHNVNQARPQPQKLPTAAPAVDFFALGSAVSTTQTPTASTSASSSLPVASSAPSLPTFQPPEPTPTDPYPGYYQLPSGAWAAHDVEYYGVFMKKWQKEYDAHVRALEKGTVKGFEGLESSTVGEVDAMQEMEKAKVEIKEREEKKAITMGAGGGPVAPKMNINASKTSGIARSRHQLSTLLKEAYENREALEERIAQGKRNRKEAGNKYGF